MKKPSFQIYQIKVTLDNIHPPIWRRIQVPGNITLGKLHDILQNVMGWQNYHLHQFTIHEQIYGDPADDEFGELGTLNEAKFTLAKLIKKEGLKFEYEYDFGDSWEHTLLLEKILPPENDVSYPLCLKGKRACPPEDVGGRWGYTDFLETIHDPSKEDHDTLLEWAGGKFDPEAFDLEVINARLQHPESDSSTDNSNVWPGKMPGPEMVNFEKAFSWMATLPEDQKLIAENLPLRRDMTSLLTYIRENKVVGTQSTGNFPLKAVKEIIAHFVDPPKFEVTLGEHVYKVHSESEVWPLYFLHILAAAGGLVDDNPARRWELTQMGENYLDKPAPFQVWFLCVTWWIQVNWAIASPISYEGGYLPAGFTKLVYKNLLEIPTTDGVLFETFADRIIKEAELVWPIQNRDSAHRILHGLIEYAVIKPLADYAILQIRYEPNKILGGDYLEPASFQITAFGKGLLEAIEETLSWKQS